MSSKEKDKLALRRQRHRETVAKLLGDAQIEIDRRRELERDRVKAFVAEVPFIRSETNSNLSRPPGRDIVSIKLRDIAEQIARDEWFYRE